MSKGNTFENDVMKFVFQTTAFAWLPLTNFYVSLHTADPGEAGSQTTSEATYGSYARQAVVRSAAGWTVTGNAATNAALIQFPTAASGTETITHVAVGTTDTGAGQIIYSGALTTPLAVSTNVRPEFAIGDLSITED